MSVANHTHRGRSFRESGDLVNGLPHMDPFSEEKKAHLRSRSWAKPAVFIPIPGVSSRRLRMTVPNDLLPYNQGGPSLSTSRKKRRLLGCFICLAVVFTVFAFSKRFKKTEESPRGPPPQEPSTLVFRREHLQSIWNWEIASGHFPSRGSVPKEIGLRNPPLNPAIPFHANSLPPPRFRPPLISETYTYGVGPQRIYPDILSLPPNVAYPPRPVPGSVADMDVIMKHCDFSHGKLVRDCLEILRLGGGLDNGKRVRRGQMEDWKYIFVEQEDNSTDSKSSSDELPTPIRRPTHLDVDPEDGLLKKQDADWESRLFLPPTLGHRTYSSLSSPCDPENPRLFHMFWTGPFTDKPYVALLSFLFTQNTGIHYSQYPEDSPVCRPQFWMWINPGPAAAVPNPSAMRDMYDQLKSNSWASPFLHPRFKDVIKFKLWNTTEQLDGVPEIKDEWRIYKDSLFNSGGYVVNVPKEEKKEESTATNATDSAHTKKADDDDILNRTGSKSSSSYDRLSVILSDMARFILCHRFGGIYLDADTIFLRDWEELWGWQGAFAYRWSRLPKYNTAVLRMNKGSALGTFLFRTALKNGLDFHPMTVSRYTSDAHIEGLLLRLPDALFDSAWLNTEYYQRDRPPHPYLSEFADFFDTPTQASAAPQALGFEGFFRGAYSYHFHNFWWKPFDPSRNWPDLGHRFISGERAARASATVADGSDSDWDDRVADDKRDLDWATVLKRTFESYIRGERPNMYGEWIHW